MSKALRVLTPLVITGLAASACSPSTFSQPSVSSESNPGASQNADPGRTQAWGDVNASLPASLKGIENFDVMNGSIPVDAFVTLSGYQLSASTVEITPEDTIQLPQGVEYRWLIGNDHTVDTGNYVAIRNGSVVAMVKTPKRFNSIVETDLEEANDLFREADATKIAEEKFGLPTEVTSRISKGKILLKDVDMVHSLEAYVTPITGIPIDSLSTAQIALITGQDPTQMFKKFAEDSFRLAKENGIFLDDVAHFGPKRFSNIVLTRTAGGGWQLAPYDVLGYREGFTHGRQFDFLVNDINAGLSGAGVSLPGGAEAILQAVLLEGALTLSNGDMVMLAPVGAQLSLDMPISNVELFNPDLVNLTSVEAEMVRNLQAINSNPNVVTVIVRRLQGMPTIRSTFSLIGELGNLSPALQLYSIGTKFDREQRMAFVDIFGIPEGQFIPFNIDRISEKLANYKRWLKTDFWGQNQVMMEWYRNHKDEMTFDDYIDFIFTYIPILANVPDSMLAFSGGTNVNAASRFTKEGLDQNVITVGETVIGIYQKPKGSADPYTFIPTNVDSIARDYNLKGEPWKEGDGEKIHGVLMTKGDNPLCVIQSTPSGLGCYPLKHFSSMLNEDASGVSQLENRNGKLSDQQVSLIRVVSYVSDLGHRSIANILKAAFPTPFDFVASYGKYRFEQGRNLLKPMSEEEYASLVGKLLEKTKSQNAKARSQALLELAAISPELVIQYS